MVHSGPTSGPRTNPGSGASKHLFAVAGVLLRPGRPATCAGDADGDPEPPVADELGLDLGATSPEPNEALFAGRTAEAAPTDSPRQRRAPVAASR